MSPDSRRQSRMESAMQSWRSTPPGVPTQAWVVSICLTIATISHPTTVMSSQGLVLSSIGEPLLHPETASARHDAVTDRITATLMNGHILADRFSDSIGKLIDTAAIIAGLPVDEIRWQALILCSGVQNRVGAGKFSGPPECVYTVRVSAVSYTRKVLDTCAMAAL